MSARAALGPRFSTYDVLFPEPELPLAPDIRRLSEETAASSPDLRWLIDLYETLAWASTPSERARKRSGAYYTPDFLVEFTVRETLKPLLAECGEPDDILNIRLLDPACGAGAFLLAAADRLAAALFERAASAGNAMSPGRCRRLAAEQLIHGTDIDPRAVELARALLVMSCASDPPAPELVSGNLVCADALSVFGSDRGHLSLPLDLDATSGFELSRCAPFKAIVGNPPYLFGENVPASVRNSRSDFRFAKGQYDVSRLFVETALGSALSDGGCHGFVLPDSILARDSAEDLRRELTGKHELRWIVHAGPVFGDAAVGAAVLIWRKCGRPGTVRRALVADRKVLPVSDFTQSDFAGLPGCRWLVSVDSREVDIIRRVIDQSVPLGDLFAVSRGEEIGKRDLQPADAGSGELVLVGEDVTQLGCPRPTRRMIPGVVKKDSSIYQAPKIVFVKTGQSIVAAVDLHGYVTAQSLYNLRLRAGTQVCPFAVCAVLGSRLMSWVARKLFTDAKTIFPQFNQSTVEDLPVPWAIIVDPNGIERAALSAAAQRLWELDRTGPDTDASEERRALLATINEIVCAVYELDAEEMERVGLPLKQHP